MVTHNKLNIYCYYVLQNNAQFVCEQTDHTAQEKMNASTERERESAQSVVYTSAQHSHTNIENTHTILKPEWIDERKKEKNTIQTHIMWMPINFEVQSNSTPNIQIWLYAFKWIRYKVIEINILVPCDVFRYIHWNAMNDRKISVQCVVLMCR